ncbi:MAG: CapA family protein [Candidatus Taylorbacteria bacterium]|nr:CapA family protein [Candidatus Taylorbacteria bacterium]
MHRAQFVWGIVVALVVVSLAFSFSKSESVLDIVTPEISKEIKMVFVGDIMLSRNIGQSMEQKKDYTFFFASTTEFLKSADITFGNLENPVSTRGIRSGSIYSFRADPQTLQGLTSAGFNVVSIANNHIWDYGKQAFKDTLSNLSENGISAVGGGENYAEAHTPKILMVGKTRIAFLAYTNLISPKLGLASSTPAISRYDDTILQTDITEAKKVSDFVAVSFHWGDEYQTKHNAEQERVGKLVIDAGANLVIGHHPHVVQEVEEYNNGYIAYSLGNFIFDQNFSKDTRHGLALLVTLKNNKISDVAKKEVSFGDDYRPHFVEPKP